MFDLPQKEKKDFNNYKKFINFLQKNGYIRIQYSIYTKLCINSFSVKTQINRLKINSPTKGDVRYLIISENQYQNIKQINKNNKLQEKIINEERLLIIGGLDDS